MCIDSKQTYGALRVFFRAAVLTVRDDHVGAALKGASCEVQVVRRDSTRLDLHRAIQFGAVGAGDLLAHSPFLVLPVCVPAWHARRAAALSSFRWQAMNNTY